jgi:two-component system, cell cycle sensor histidine kinase and response regulator CckA
MQDKPPALLPGAMEGEIAGPAWREASECKRLGGNEPTEAERRLRHIQKMEVVGKFAGGIAHDLNNILTVIVGSSQLLLDHPEVGRAAGQRVQQILDAGFRAANLTSHLLSFSRKQSPRRVTLDLNRVIGDSTNMIRFLLGSGIELTTLLAADLRHVSADPVQMEQVLINLCLNARDAMPRGGSIFIETQNVEVREADVARDGLAMKPGGYVRCSVTDTGEGMDEVTLARVFEPFFTTKQPDQGLGLGLATVECIVRHAATFGRRAAPGRVLCFRFICRRRRTLRLRGYRIRETTFVARRPYCW